MVSLRPTLAALIAGGILQCGVFASVAADDAAATAAVERWIASQAGVRTWSAQLTQTRKLKTLKQPLVSTGRVWFAAPQRFRWELGDPAQTIAVRRATELAVVYPRLERAELFPLGASATGPWKAALDLLEAGFPQSRAELDARFQLRGAAVEDGRLRARLVPRDAAARRLIALLLVETEAASGALLATEIEFADGSTLRNDFTAAQANPALDEGLFEYRIPEHFTVVRPPGATTKAKGTVKGTAK
jgi:outer membrane lipoprotein-sorting protein